MAHLSHGESPTGRAESMATNTVLNTVSAVVTQINLKYVRPTTLCDSVSNILCLIEVNFAIFLSQTLQSTYFQHKNALLELSKIPAVEFPKKPVELCELSTSFR